MVKLTQTATQVECVYNNVYKAQQRNLWEGDEMVVKSIKGLTGPRHLPTLWTL